MPPGDDTPAAAASIGLSTAAVEITPLNLDKPAASSPVNDNTTDKKSGVFTVFEFLIF